MKESSSKLPPGTDLRHVLEEARFIADGVGQRVNTSHILFALFTTNNPSEILLRERGVDAERLIELLERKSREASAAVPAVLEYAEQTALRCDSRDINTLHLLVGMLRGRETLAYGMLERALGAVSPFRNKVMSYLTGILPRRLKQSLLDARKVPDTNDAPTKAKRPLRPKQNRTEENFVVPRGTWIDSVVPSALCESDPEDEDRVSVVSHAPSTPSPSTLDQAASNIIATPSKRNDLISAAPSLLPTDYDLDPDQFPWLCTLGRNLTALADHGLLDPAIGRSAEINQVIDVLGKRRANNPCLVGEPGVGKTAIAEGLAVMQVRGDDDVLPLLGKVIVELDMGRISAGTSLRGSFSERLQGLKKDVARARGRVIVFIDEIHTLMGAGSSGEGPQDAANELKAALARGDFPCIGSTTLDEYRKYIEADPALERRFVRVVVDEPEDNEAIEMLRGAAPLYETHHEVTCTDDAICAAVQLSTRFIHDRKLPGKALDLLDLSLSRAKRSGQRRVGREAVAKVCAEMAKVPLDRILLEDTKRFLDMEAFLERQVVGHSDVIAAVADTIRRNYAGFASSRPLGSFLFFGPSGVGKTELALALADFLYGTSDALIRFDMSEFGEAHTAARLVGAPPGYVGHQDGGQLTEAIGRRPHAVVLLDEVEKAHGDILPILLQILDEGRLTDAKGRTVTFRHATVILTSNLGADTLRKRGRKVGFGAAAGGDDLDTNGAIEAARSHFPPELWGRIDEKRLFTPLSRRELIEIARLLLQSSATALHTTRNISLSFDDDLLEFLVDHGGIDEATGARPLRMAIKRHVETPVAEVLLRKDLTDGGRAHLAIREDRVVVRRRP